MVRHIALIAGFFAGLVVGCPTAHVPSGDLDTSGQPSNLGPLPDEETPEAKQSKPGQACSNLRALQCKDGFARKDEPSCTATMQKAISRAITVVPVDCIIAAKTKSQARACGSYVECP